MSSSRERGEESPPLWERRVRPATLDDPSRPHAAPPPRPSRNQREARAKHEANESEHERAVRTRSNPRTSRCQLACAENPCWSGHAHFCALHRDMSWAARGFRQRLPSSRGRCCPETCSWPSLSSRPRSPLGDFEAQAALPPRGHPRPPEQAPDEPSPEAEAPATLPMNGGEDIFGVIHTRI